jgi:hypothetical protein
MSENIFLSDQNSVSHRWAILEDDGLSAWLYLTESGSPTLAADCWIYNRILDSEMLESDAMLNTSPPAPSEYTGGSNVIISPDVLFFRLVWSKDGNSVAFFDRNILMGFIAAGRKRGYSRNLMKAGAWGNILDYDLHTSLFY